MLKDGNPMVVANTIYALQSIEQAGGPKLKIDQNHIQKFLTALNEATEWGQSIILDCISNFKPTSSDMAERVIVRIKGFTLHRNPGVNLSAVRVIMKYLDFLEDSETVRSFGKSIRPCLITLLSAEPEIQFVALKNINILAEKYTFIVETELKHFFCNFSDPLYVKTQKLEIMVKLANESNIDMILHELKEYVSEVDIEFVRKCISAIGKLSIKIEKTATKCVFALREIISSNKSNLIVQETIIVLKDIFRKYPERYEKILVEVMSEIKAIDEPESKAALLWIIGEYIESIDDAHSILSVFLENFKEEPSEVQLQLLTTCIKFALVSPAEGKPIVRSIFEMLEDVENVDVRDRGYFYWRLISTNAQFARQLLFENKHSISETQLGLEPALLNTLVETFNSLSCVYVKYPTNFVRVKIENRGAFDDEEEEEEEAVIIDSTGQEMGAYQNPFDQQNAPDDYLDVINENEENPNQNNKIVVPFNQVLSFEDQSLRQNINGLQIQASLQLEGNQNDLVLYMKIENQIGQDLNDLMIKFQNNSYCLNPVSQDLPILSFPNGQESNVRIALNMQGNSNGLPPDCPIKIKVAINTNLDIFVFDVPCSFSLFLRKFDQEVNEDSYKKFITNERAIKTKNSIECEETKELIQHIEQFINKLENNNIFLVFRQSRDTGEMLNCMSATVDGLPIAIQIYIPLDGDKIMMNYVVPDDSIVLLVFQAIKFIINL